jgi:SAM-dependent methyltransferase
MPIESCYLCGGVNAEDFCSARDRLAGGRWRILHCPDCGFGWTSPPLDEAQIPLHYPTAYLGDTRQTLEDYFSGKLAGSRSWRGELQKVRLLEKYAGPGRILDVGCGDGKFLWALDADRWDRTGVEASADTVATVQNRMPSLQLVAGNIYSEKLEVEGYDAITFWHVLEHLPQPRKVLQRASELLVPGGWLFLSLPNLESMQARLFRQHWYPFGDVPRHLYHFSRRSIDELLAEVPLEVSGHHLFSPLVNFHSWKHSLLQWSMERYGNRVPYYLLKPLLFAAPWIERATGQFGILTTVARKPASPE